MLDGYAVWIGLKHLGDPEGFYKLSRERQIDTLAALQVDSTKGSPPPEPTPWDILNRDR